MTLSPAAIATARRNLPQRIQRFIDALDLEKREPTRWQGDHIVHAIEMLQSAHYRTGENYMLRAERASAFQSAANLSPIVGEAPTARELRARLIGALNGEG